jgi:PadR family transcriptional regulator, regulatory protein PadR
MSRKPRRLSPQTLSVLIALRDCGQDWMYGLELSAATALKSGSLYPLLIRVNDRGLVESRWLEPEKPGRPPRHAYRLTGAGRAAIIEAASVEDTQNLSTAPMGI